MPIPFSEHYIQGPWATVSTRPRKPDTYKFIDLQETRFCRFCQLQEPQTTFLSKAHAIPQLMGNQELLLFSECDKCNKLFGKLYENHLANYFSGLRAAMGQKGEKGIIRYDAADRTLAIRHEPGADGHRLVVAADLAESHASIDHKNHRLKLSIPRSRHIPYAVYKAFLKIGFSFLPLRSDIDYQKLASFLRSKISSENGRVYSASGWHYQISNHFGRCSVAMYERKKTSPTSVPRFVFLVAFHHLVYQFPIPSEDWQDLEFEFGLIHFADSISRPMVINLGSVQSIIGPPETIDFAFDPSANPELEKNDLYLRLKNRLNGA